MILLAALIGSTHAAKLPPRIGLVIGNSMYLNQKDSLPGAQSDAKSIRDALEKVKFDVTLVQNATKNELETAIKSFRQRLEEAGPLAVGLLYYAGHGAADRKRIANYLIPVDVDNATTTDSADGGVAVRWIIEQLRILDKPMTIVIVIDACRAPGANNVERGERDQKGTKTQEILDPDEPDSGYLIAFSTSHGHPASDSSTYAKVLADKLTSAGLTIDQVFEEVRVEVAGDSKTRQLPFHSSKVTEKVCLVNCKADTLRELAEKIDTAISAHDETDKLLRQELGATRVEIQDFRQRLQKERTNAINEILRRVGDSEVSVASLAQRSLEKGDVQTAEAMLRAIEATAVAKQDFPEAARIARQIGGLSSVRSVRLAVTSFRRAASYEPENPENWRLLGGLWRGGSELEDFQHAYERLVALLAERAERAPNDAQLQRELADSHSKLGDVLVQFGNNPKAQLAFQNGVSILNKFITTPRVSVGVLDELGHLYGQLGEALIQMGDVLHAKESYARALDIYRQFSQTETSHVSAGLTIGDLERKTGGAYLMEGNRPQAMRHFRLALEIQERLAEEHPGDRLILRGVALAQRGVGFGLVKTNDFVGANGAFNRALRTTQRLIATDTKDTVLRYDLAHIQFGLGEAAMGQGDYLLATRSYNNALEIMAELVVLNPRRIPWQKEKLSANTRIGDAAAAYGANQQAIAAYRNSLIIHDELATLLQQVGSKYEQRAQANSLEQVGASLSRLKDSRGALVAFRRTLAIREDLLRGDPSDAETEGAIAISCWNIAAMKGFADVDNAEVASKLNRGKMILQKLREEGRLNNKQHADMEQRFDTVLQTPSPTDQDRNHKKQK
jgi:tetratricopeptide (TPR) repeat protein